MEKIDEGGKESKQIDSTQLVSRRDMKQEPASNHRDPSPDILLRGGASQAAAQNSQGNTGWKEWTQEQCQEIVDSLQGKKAPDEQLLQLQRMLDELTAVPEICTSAALANFLTNSS